VCRLLNFMDRKGAPSDAKAARRAGSGAIRGEFFAGLYAARGGVGRNRVRSRHGVYQNYLGT
jgi:hypothetical protein